MTYYTVEQDGYREVREDVRREDGALITTTHSRTRLAPQIYDNSWAENWVINFVGSGFIYALLFLLLAWGVVSLVGNLGFLVLLVAAPILYVSFSRRMAGVRCFLRGTVSGIREWVADRV